MLSMLKRHFDVLRTSWSEENEQVKQRRRYKEEEFLPAALEILEKPPSPLGRTIIWTIVAFFVISVAWATLGRVDVVSSANGKTLPRERVKIMQAPEAGVVRSISVVDGQRVKAGDILINLDPTNAEADKTQAREQLAIAEIDLARGAALIAFLDGGEPTFDLPDAAPEIIEGQQALINAQIAEYQAQAAALGKQSEERQADIQVTTAQISKLRKMLPMAREQVTAREALLKEGYAARLVVLEVQERVVSMEQDLVMARDELVKARAAHEAVARQIDQLREEFRKNILSDRAEAQARARLAREELTKAALRRDLQSLRAPIDGVVQQLAVHTIGAVVKPGDPLLVVVPGEGELVVEAMVLNRDIGFVAAGDLAEIKLEAFPFTRYGVIHGVVENISTDAIQDEQLGLVYAARVVLDAQTIEASGRPVTLSPGMSATVEIKTGTRRVIEYVLSPLLRYRDESLRER